MSNEREREGEKRREGARLVEKRGEEGMRGRGREREGERGEREREREHPHTNRNPN